MQRIILHSVGTSLLTNRADSELRKKINQATNQQKLEVDPVDRQQMTSLLDDSRQQIDSLRGGASASAELAGLARLYADKTSITENDIHFLVHTDTYVGSLCADYLAQVMKDLGISGVNKVNVVGLTTQTKAAFQAGMKWLINWCEDTLPGYRDSQYEVIFNLTGGFKSLQGYLNIVGMFYADKIVYKFETGDELIEIPRLPIRLDDEVVQRGAAAFLMADHTICSSEQVRTIPPIYLDEDEGLCTLSPIGKLIWSRNKGRILKDQLVEIPRLVYEDSFRKDFKNADREPVKLQETLVKVSCLMAEHNGNTAALKRDGGLQYENFQNRQANGLPIGHFRITQETRVSCVSRDGALYLRHFGAHDYVNDNP